LGSGGSGAQSNDQRGEVNVNGNIGTGTEVGVVLGDGCAVRCSTSEDAGGRVLRTRADRLVSRVEINESNIGGVVAGNSCIVGAQFNKCEGVVNEFGNEDVEEGDRKSVLQIADRSSIDSN